MVRTRFEDLYSAISPSMERFSVPGYKILLLPVYTQAANLHLVMAQDAERYGIQWEMTQQTIDFYYKEQREKAVKYAGYCVKWYKEGLDSLKKSSAGDWIKYNRYRREMTLSVLDYVALFSAYDLRIYPIKTTPQLTREIYTDATSISTYYKNPSQLPSLYSSEKELPPQTLDEPSYKAYSHRLCHISFANNNINSKYRPYVPVFSWTHRSTPFITIASPNITASRI